MTRLLRCRLALALAFSMIGSLAAAQAPAQPDTVAPSADAPDGDPLLQVLDTVVVSGLQPGPGLWRVSKDGRVMWVLGTLLPLPKRMEWNSAEVEAKVAASGVLVMPPRTSVSVGGSMFGAMFLVPSLLKARNNPGKERLQEVLPPADYARWQGLKARYLPRDGAVEKRRPLLAAMELRDKAFDREDLSLRNIVSRVVTRAAEKADVPIEQPSVGVELEDPKGTLKELASNPLQDLDCFRRTMDQVENDLGTLATRANAWAQGEVAMLRDLTYTDNAQACSEAVLQSALAQRKGMSDLPAQAQAAWMAAAEKALATHAQSFAVLPMARVVGPSGYLAALEQRGYRVQAPDEPAAQDPAPTDAD
ncbi:MAG: TraB/GumN family protein [Arenimonas sp.]|uniref:TraB/GumN family protein n=1 Tax=Arenimonas sp. TaxID=1872635 RepID=UPI0025BC7CD3|nr:TraB/GumN family protein [Arenimonas sp.]MBW8368293.1 TraB/GumN family protein [Arenimonas sp.]